MPTTSKKLFKVLIRFTDKPNDTYNRDCVWVAAFGYGKATALAEEWADSQNREYQEIEAEIVQDPFLEEV